MDPNSTPIPSPTGLDLPLERLAFSASLLGILGPILVQGAAALLGLGAQDIDPIAMVTASLLTALAAVGGAGIRVGPLSSRWLPAVLAAAAGAGMALVLAEKGSFAPVIGCLGAVGLLQGLLMPRLLQSLPGRLDGIGRREPLWTGGTVLLAFVALFLHARLSVYMGDPGHPELSLMPNDAFITTHSCLSAYVEGARLAEEGAENLYHVEHWPHLAEGAEPPLEARYQPFPLDTYAYPPPFLLLPQFLLGWLPTFYAQRALWYAFNALAVAGALWTVAWWVGGRAGTRTLLLAPAIWLSAPLLVTLQIGNVHAVIVSLTLVALVAFETRRTALGGALLAFAIVAKISPGIVLLVLLVQRHYRALLWTAAWALLYSIASTLLFGTAPLTSFISYELPRLSSGEALSFLALPESIAFNLAPFGVPFKLANIGVFSGDAWEAGRIWNQVYTLALGVITVLAARKGGGRRAKAELWAGLAMAAALRSPYAPGYVAIAMLWLLSLVAQDLRNYKQVIGMALLWLMMTIPMPLEGTAELVGGLAGQAVMMGALGHFLLRKPPMDEGESGFS